MKTTSPSRPSVATLASSPNSSRSAAAPSALAHPAVLIEQAARSFGDVEAVRPLRLSIQPGETVALLGPSGSGKTTLLSMIAGELEPTKGSIHLHGSDLAGLRPGRELCRKVGMVHQQYDLVPNLSALHNALAGRLGTWGLFRSLVSLVWPQDRQMGMTALERLGVADRARVRAGFLSGGEQQRVALARLLLQDPAIIVADEPVSSLDPARAEEVMSILSGSVRDSGRTLIAAVHSADIARAYFGRLIGLRDGVCQFDLPADLVSDRQLNALYSLDG